MQNKQKSFLRIWLKRSSLMIGVSLILVFEILFGQSHFLKSSLLENVFFETEYHSVYLDNNEVFFGELIAKDKNGLILIDVCRVKPNAEKIAYEYNIEKIHISLERIIFTEALGKGAKVKNRFCYSSAGLELRH